MQRLVISTMNMKKLVTSVAQLVLEEERNRALDGVDTDFLLDEACRIGVGRVDAPLDQPLVWQQL